MIAFRTTFPIMLFPRILSASTLRKLQSHLKKGGLVAYPTESCYGIGCIPTLPKALNRLIHLKKRPQHKGMIVIGNQLEQLQPLLKRSSENHEYGDSDDLFGFFGKVIFRIIHILLNTRFIGSKHNSCLFHLSDF